jgi:hypothetical protein
MNEQTRETRETRVERDVTIGRVVGQSTSYGPGGYAIGIVDVGESGRQEHGGPVVDGPWGYVYGLASVIDNAGGTRREHDDARDAGRWLDEVGDGDVLVVDGRRYRVDVGRMGRVRLVALDDEPEGSPSATRDEREHWHVVVALVDDARPSIERDHAAWHETREPCLVCDARATTTCPSTSAHLSEHGRESVARRYCKGSSSERGSTSALVAFLFASTLVAVLGIASLVASVVDLSDERDDKRAVRVELSRERERDAREVDEYLDESESVYVDETSATSSDEPRVELRNCLAEDDFGALALVDYERDRIVLRCLPH